MANYKLATQGVIRTLDGASIPAGVDNRDWRDYQTWLALGNTPDPKDSDPLPTQEHIDAIAAKADVEVIALSAMTPAQARAYVLTNINSLSDAKAFLGRVAAILSVLTKSL